MIIDPGIVVEIFENDLFPARVKLFERILNYNIVTFLENPDVIKVNEKELFNIVLKNFGHLYKSLYA